MVAESKPRCTRTISLLPVKSAGFGHRFGMLMFGMDLAARTRSELSLSDDFWSGRLASPMHAREPGYMWAWPCVARR